MQTDGRFVEYEDEEAQRLAEQLLNHVPVDLSNEETFGIPKMGKEAVLEEIDNLDIAAKKEQDMEKRMDKLEKKVNRILIHLGIDDKSEVLKI